MLFARRNRTLSVLAALVLGIYPLAAVADSGDPISQLENKLFMHDYPRDSEEDRLARLENMVFGEKRTGPTDQRVAKLTEVLGPSKQAVAQDKPATAAAPQEPAAPPPPQAIADSSKYPAVTEMENKIYGRSYAGSPIAARLERLENKVFGKPMSGDLIDRVDRLRESTGTDLANNSDDSEGSDMGATQDFTPENSPPPASRQYRAARPPAPPSPSAISRADSDWKAKYGQPGTGIDEVAPQPFAVSPFRHGKSKLSKIAAEPSSKHGPMPIARPRDQYSNDLDAPPPVAPSIASAFGYPRPAPPLNMVPNVQTYGGSPQVAPPIGLTRQVSTMEFQVFRKTLGNLPLPLRISKLESAVFLGEGGNPNDSLADRVSRLASVLNGRSWPGGTPNASAYNRGFYR